MHRPGKERSELRWLASADGSGLTGIAVGILSFLWPGVTALALLYLVAAWAVVRGVFEIVAAFHLRRELENEWLLALSGLLSVLLGLFLFMAPGAGALPGCGGLVAPPPSSACS